MAALILTTVEKPASPLLVDLASAKDELQITDEASDVFLYRAITQASALVTGHCNRQINLQTIQDVINPDPRTSFDLALSAWPVVSVQSVVTTDLQSNQYTLNPTPIPQTDPTLAPLPPDYLLKAPVGRLVGLDDYGSPTPWPALTTTVTYIAGYAPVPADIQDVVLRMVVKRYKGRGRDPMLRSQSTDGVANTQWWVPTDGLNAMGDDILAVLNRYRMPEFG